LKLWYPTSQTRVEAEKLAFLEYAVRIRRTERLLGAIGDSNRMKILLLLSNKRCPFASLNPALNYHNRTVRWTKAEAPGAEARLGFGPSVAGRLVHSHDDIHILEKGLGPVLDIVNRVRGYEYHARGFNCFCVHVGYDFGFPIDHHDKLLPFFGRMFPNLLAGFQYYIA